MKYRSREEVEAIEYRDDNLKEVVKWLYAHGCTTVRMPWLTKTLYFVKGAHHYGPYSADVVFHEQPTGIISVLNVDYFNELYEPVKSYATGGYVGKGGPYVADKRFGTSCYFPWTDQYLRMQNVAWEGDSLMATVGLSPEAITAIQNAEVGGYSISPCCEDDVN